MAPGAIGDSCDDIIARARGRWTESSIVYTRRSRKKPKLNSADKDDATAATAAEDVGNCATISVAKDKDDGSVQEPVGKNYQDRVPEVSCSPATEVRNPECDPALPNLINECPNSKKTPNLGDSLPFSSGNDLQNPGEAVEVLMHESEEGKSDLPEGHDGPVNVDGVVKPLVISKDGDKIRFGLSKATPKNDIKVLKRVLSGELDQVARLVKQLEAKEIEFASSNINLSNVDNYRASGASISGYSHPQHTRNEVIDRRLLGRQEARPMGLSRVNSDMGAMRNMGPCPYRRQLSVSVMENSNRGGEFVEKEKRTPKANQFYRNSEFLLGKDKLPSESIKKQKLNNRRRHSGELNHLFDYGARLEKNRKHVFKNCSSLLQRLMKHKHGWVFNEPVNANFLGLVDYHDIIKHPMDLGTIKTRLSQNWYKTPMEFAEDVRLVFLNAMTYNPEGHDVHVMARQLSDVFEERWAVIEFEYNSFNWKHQTYPDEMLPTPTSRMAPPQSHFDPSSAVSAPISLYLPAAAAQMRTFDRPGPIGTPMAVGPKIQLSHPRRTPAPRKPKAKDPDKRDMTFDEKRKLGNSLQDMPSEKLDAIVQIIKRGNTELYQNDDEVEVDIDSVNTETLWELDRFVTNYKKSLSKNRRKAELALQARTTANQSVSLMGSVPLVAGQIGSVTAFGKSANPLAEGQKRVTSSSSSSSSSDSGSTSSDSDSDSSSSDGSDGGHSPRQ